MSWNDGGMGGCEVELVFNLLERWHSELMAWSWASMASEGASARAEKRKLMA